MQVYHEIRDILSSILERERESEREREGGKEKEKKTVSATVDINHP